MMPSLWVLAPPSKARTRYYSERSAWCWQRVTVLSSVPWALQWREDFSVKEDHQFISNERNLGQRACPRRAFDMKLVWSQEASGYWHLKPSVFLLWASFPKWRNWTHESKFSSHFHSLWAHLWKADDEKAKSVQGQRNFQGPGFTGHIFPFLTTDGTSAAGRKCVEKPLRIWGRSADSSASCWDLQLSSPHFGSFSFFWAWKSFSSSWTPRHFFICQNSFWKVRWWDLSSWERVVCLMLEFWEMHMLH